MLKGNRNKFTKAGSMSSHPFDEPTFMSFFLLFDWSGPGSPLFNGEAAAFLKDVLGDAKRAKQLERFKKYLQRINMEMPWFWQSITGVDAAHTYGGLKDPYAYAEGDTLEIECLETLDFTIAGIFDIYKNVCLDTTRMVEVLPSNLRKFDLYVHVQEIRNFVPFIGSESNMTKAAGALGELQAVKGMDAKKRKAYLDSKKMDIQGGAINMIEDRLNSDQLDWKSKGLGPRFITRFGSCRFDWDNAAQFFGEITNNDMSTPVKHKLKINFKKSRMTEMEYLTHYNHSEPEDPFSPFDGDITEQLKKAALKAGTEAGEQALTAGKAALERGVENFKNGLLLGNVYGANALSKIQDVMNSGSINAIGPLVKGEDPSREPENIGRPVGENIHPASPPPEISLESTKIFEDSLEKEPLVSENILPTTPNENPLGADNVNPPRSSENDTQLGNINN